MIEDRPWYPPGPAMLFCPANRPDRYTQALDRADAVILDLEDAVAEVDKPAAREALLATPVDPQRVIVRVNPATSPHYLDDLAAIAKTAYSVVMLAKTESAAQVTDLHLAIGASVLGLCETPRGILQAPQIGEAAGCIGLMWGAEDLIADIGGTTSRFSREGRRLGQYRDAARFARSQVLLAAAAAGRFAVDSVHLDIDDLDGQRAEAVDAVACGFCATACIHPNQVPVIREAYAPPPDLVDWARQVLSQAGERGVFQLAGQMIDEPLLRQAEAILHRAALCGEPVDSEVLGS